MNEEDFSNFFIMSQPPLPFTKFPKSLICKENYEIAKYISCQICKEIPLNPITCKNCETIYCNECLNNNNIKKCNINCERFEKKDLSNLLKKLLSKIKLRCYFYESGCEEIILFKNFINHIKNCEYSEYICSNCQFFGNKRQCIIHYLTKENLIINDNKKNINDNNKIINCEFCKERIPFNSYLEHKNLYCTEIVEECNECKIYYKRTKLINHSKIECLNNQIEYYKNIVNFQQDTINMLEIENSNLRNDGSQETNSLNIEEAVENENKLKENWKILYEKINKSSSGESGNDNNKKNNNNKNNNDNNKNNNDNNKNNKKQNKINLSDNNLIKK